MATDLRAPVVPGADLGVALAPCLWDPVATLAVVDPKVVGRAGQPVGHTACTPASLQKDFRIFWSIPRVTVNSVECSLQGPKQSTEVCQSKVYHLSVNADKEHSSSIKMGLEMAID